MSTSNIILYVYAHWKGMDVPKRLGLLTAQQIKSKKVFNFEYDSEWVNSKEQFILDPDISLFSGKQFPNNKSNFGMFLDSMPDTWGRTLLKKREILQAQEEKRPIRNLYDLDYLLGVYDECRMGAIRFKLSNDGPFLDDSPEYPTPPWTSIRELQRGVEVLESENNSELKKWLSILMAPGSSLGGARPKANVLDETGHPWIAKFPSKNDTIDKGAWEYLCYRLAIDAGIDMPESKIKKLGRYHIFFSKRFDRENGARIHFASAMTMTGNTEEILKSSTPSYLEIAEFIQFTGLKNKEDLHQLWKRIVFNIQVSNTDDHLRNHGFLIKEGGWRLSPAYDINPSVDKEGLALNITMDDNSQDLELAKSVGEYFKLSNPQMNQIINDVLQSVKNWKREANKIGISRSEQILMQSAFKV